MSKQKVQKGIPSLFRSKPVRKRGNSFLSSLFGETPRKPKRKSPPPKDPKLEIDDGRRFRGGSLDKAIQRLWDAPNEQGEMGRVLQPRSREEAEQRIREKADAAKERNTQLYTASRRPEFNLLVSYLKKMELGAYANLHHPENRKEKISLEEFIGTQNGIIYAVESIRSFYTMGINGYRKAEEDELRSKTRTIRQQKGHSEKSG